MKYRDELIAINHLVKNAVKASNPKLPDLSQYSKKAQIFGKDFFARRMTLYD
ncbi:MAG: hypothetical protein K0S08_1257 [Gammaproteobacteria bacterium]|jgi:hypothetical protein|nr:hypothetical protein [Gammaproteobacteria bacterium]